LNSVCLTFCLLLLSPFATKTFSQPPDPSQIPEPQIAYALHATWDPDLTDNNPSICTNSGTVAVPSFHFYAGWKDGAPAFFSVDWVLIEELTANHEPQVWLFGNLQGSSGFPSGCTMPPVSDPENWNWTTWSFEPMIGFAMHNTSYRVTVQWRYGVYMKGPRGPFQTSITINVQNLVVTSPDETKVLKWDPRRGIKDTSFSYYIDCAQRKRVQVRIQIYDLHGNLVHEVTEVKECPGNYSFTWDPGNLIPAGLYTFDCEVEANPYDKDVLRSNSLFVAHVSNKGDITIVYKRISIIGVYYCLCSDRSAAQVILSLYDPLLEQIDQITGNTEVKTENRDALCGILNYAGNYHILISAQDNHLNNRAHRRKWTLPLGENIFVMPCAHYGFANWGFFEDTDGEAWKAYDELGEVYNPITAKLQLCYSGWYPLRDKGGVLINKPKSHALNQIMPGIFGGTLLENTIWTFSGHGNVGAILFGYENDPNNWLTDQEVLELPDGSLGIIKVALVLSCKSAPEFISSLVQKGARSAVGFQELITFVGGSYWNGWFWEILTKEGKTVGEAALEATIRTWWIPDTGLISVDVQGERGTVIY